jgi:hypothetical protein
MIRTIVQQSTWHQRRKGRSDGRCDARKLLNNSCRAVAVLDCPFAESGFADASVRRHADSVMPVMSTSGSVESMESLHKRQDEVLVSSKVQIESNQEILDDHLAIRHDLEFAVLVLPDTRSFDTGDPGCEQA